MKKAVLGALVVVICASAFLSGCQDTSSVKTQKIAENVFLDSTIVEFANASYQKNINKSGGIDSVTVSWLFHNIAGREISYKIDVKFFDKHDTVLYNITKKWDGMPAGYTEQFDPRYNKVIYDGVGAAFVDHVVIFTTEITS